MIVVWLLSAVFACGLYVLLSRRDLIALLAGVELMLGAASGLFVLLARSSGASAETTEAIGLLLVVLAAAEAAVSMALVIALARHSGRSTTEELTEVRG